jgi:membrane protein
MTIVLAMTALYALLPFTRVRFRAALTGGLLCGIGLEAAKIGVQIFAFYVGENYTRIYGPLLAVPFVLLWLWLVWVIILMGAEVAFVVQNFTDLAARAEMEKRGIQSRFYLAIRTVLAASSLFHRGENPENLIETVAAELYLPPYMVRHIVQTLVQCNVLRRIADGEEAFVPAKDISVLTIYEVIHAVENDHLDVPTAPDDAVRRFLADIFKRSDAVRHEIMGNTSFIELVELSRSWSETEETVTFPYKPDLADVDEVAVPSPDADDDAPAETI